MQVRFELIGLFRFKIYGPLSLFLVVDIRTSHSVAARILMIGQNRSADSLPALIYNENGCNDCPQAKFQKRANLKYIPFSNHALAHCAKCLKLTGLCASEPQSLFQRTRVARHAVTAQPVDDRDEKVELKRPDLAIIDDLRGLRQIYVTDDRRQ